MQPSSPFQQGSPTTSISYLTKRLGYKRLKRTDRTAKSLKLLSDAADAVVTVELLPNLVPQPFLNAN